MNNYHSDFPAIMSDGRNYTSWLPNAKMNEQIIKQNQLKTNGQYRNYLIKNATQIIKGNQKNACQGSSACAVQYNGPHAATTPYLYQSTTDQTTPFGYESSDLKETFLMKQNEQTKVQPRFTQDSFR